MINDEMIIMIFNNKKEFYNICRILFYYYAAPPEVNNQLINQVITELAINTTINQPTACIKIVLPFLTFSSSQAAVKILKPP
jgi:hypothetical protein